MSAKISLYCSAEMRQMRHNPFSDQYANIHTITVLKTLPLSPFLSLLLIHPRRPPTHPVLKKRAVWYTMVIKVRSDWKYIRTPYHFNARALICQDTGCNWILIGY